MAVEDTNLHRRVALNILRITGSSIGRLSLGYYNIVVVVVNIAVLNVNNCRYNDIVCIAVNVHQQHGHNSNDGASGGVVGM